MLLALAILLSACASNSNAIAVGAEITSPTASIIPTDTAQATMATPAVIPTATAPTPTPSEIATASPVAERDSAPPLSERFRARSGDKVTEIRPGVIHIQRVLDEPLRINILLFDLTAPEFSLKVALGNGWLSGRTRTSYMVGQSGALAGVNGDLFSSNGIPQSLTIIDSRIAMAPKHRATFAWSPEKGPFIGYFTDEWTWQARVVAPNGRHQPIYLLNSTCDPNMICLFNRFARRVPARAGDVKVVLGPLNNVDRIVEEKAVKISPGSQVLQATGLAVRWLLNNVEVGEKLEIEIFTDPPLSQYTQAISGGPIILRDGKFVQDCLCALRDCSETDEEDEDLFCEDFSTDWKLHHYLWVRMPRTGVGFDKERQTLIVAVVDGYQAGYSRGIEQEKFAALLREFGADEAMEFDGGGSTTMVLDQRIVNRPSDDTGERYVANALLFFWDEETQTTAPELRRARPLPGQPPVAE